MPLDSQNKTSKQTSLNKGRISFVLFKWSVPVKNIWFLDLLWYRQNAKLIFHLWSTGTRQWNRKLNDIFHFSSLQKTLQLKFCYCKYIFLIVFTLTSEHIQLMEACRLLVWMCVYCRFTAVQVCFSKSGVWLEKLLTENVKLYWNRPTVGHVCVTGKLSAPLT